jgi:phosphomannomutase
VYDDVAAWIADDPDPGDRAELAGLLERGELSELRDRFAGRLRFGTAGLRGPMAAGPNRMNRAVVRAATAAVAGWLADSGASPLVVVGCDARHRSREFAEEVVRVLAGAGTGVHVLPLPCPTPLLAFAVRHLSASAGVMITASHNPAADNGYKLYLSDGAQVIPPVDAEIEERMSGLGPLSAIAIAGLDSPLITWHGDEIAEAYLDAVVRPFPVPPLRVVYTPMHGVAGPLMLRALGRAGFAEPHVVPAQGTPDPDFPTVAFPNPEEPGALDLALAEARTSGADLVLASDPDGDRLAVAVRDGSDFRVLTGNQLGSLLGAYLLRSAPGLVATTIVSSSMLAKIAAAFEAPFAETLTGFKWISRAGEGLVFGYEEALGYQVGTAVRDKDGIGAALAVLRMASSGRTLLDLYDDLERVYGVHLTAQVSVRTDVPGEVMRRLRAHPPAVPLVRDYLPASDVLRYEMDGAWVAVRPSGTEPKVKAYLEVITPASPSLSAARIRAATRMEALASAVRGVLEDGDDVHRFVRF